MGLDPSYLLVPDFFCSFLGPTSIIGGEGSTLAFQEKSQLVERALRQWPALRKYSFPGIAEKDPLAS